MPILDLRIRKAVRRERRQAAGRLRAARPRSTAAPTEAVRYAPGEAAAFVRRAGGRARRRGLREGPGPRQGGPRRSPSCSARSPDPVIVWGERLWRSPGAVEALHDCARALDMHQRIGPGLLEVPEESNARGLREVGCLPGAGPGLAPAGAGRDAAEIKEGLAAGELDALLLLNADPVRTHPDRDGWREALGKAFVVSVAMFDDESTKHADIVLPAETHAEKEGTVTHPDGRLQRLRRNVPLPEDVRPGWQILTELSAALGRDLGLRHRRGRLRRALGRRSPSTARLTYEEIGGHGLRWQERDPGDVLDPGPRAAAPERRAPPAPPDAARRRPDGLVLGTYRDLWASEVTERNPALRFLMPTQKLELAAKDAEGARARATAIRSPCRVNGTSVEAARRDPASGCGRRGVPDRGHRASGNGERARERHARGGSRWRSDERPARRGRLRRGDLDHGREVAPDLPRRLPDRPDPDPGRAQADRPLPEPLRPQPGRPGRPAAAARRHRQARRQGARSARRRGAASCTRSPRRW